jgi:hypothetical protein
MRTVMVPKRHVEEYEEMHTHWVAVQVRGVR